MAATREAALAALAATVAAALPGVPVERNAELAEAIGPSGSAVVREGDPGEPERTLGVTSFGWSHEAALELLCQGESAAQRVRLHQMIAAVEAEIAADRTLGGAVDWCELRAPSIEVEAWPGTGSVTSAELAVLLVYETASSVG